MTETQDKLQEFARSRALPYLLELPLLKPYADGLSLVLVGSAASGLCRLDSDVDIAIICDNETYKIISQGTSWDVSRPTEITIDGIQLHYFARSFEQIEERLSELDDDYLYHYSNAVVLRDPRGQFTGRLGKLFSHSPEVRKQRLEGKLDMLVRRSRALESCLDQKDILTIARVCLELITLCLKVTPLLGDVPFDPRKRLFSTALKGCVGGRVGERIRELLSSLGTLGQLREDSDFVNFAFQPKLAELSAILCEEARKQGFRVGLDSPDRRHIER